MHVSLPLNHFTGLVMDITDYSLNVTRKKVKKRERKKTRTLNVFAWFSTRMVVLQCERKEEKFSILGRILCILHTQTKKLATKK